MPTEMEEDLWGLCGCLVIKNTLGANESYEREVAIAAGADFASECDGFGSPLNGDIILVILAT